MSGKQVGFHVHICTYIPQFAYMCWRSHVSMRSILKDCGDEALHHPGRSCMRRSLIIPYILNLMSGLHARRWIR